MWLYILMPLWFGASLLGPLHSAFWLLYTPSVHKFVERIPLLASHTCSVQYMSYLPPLIQFQLVKGRINMRNIAHNIHIPKVMF